MASPLKKLGTAEEFRCAANPDEHDEEDIISLNSVVGLPVVKMVSFVIIPIGPRILPIARHPSMLLKVNYLDRLHWNLYKAYAIGKCPE